MLEGLWKSHFKGPKYLANLEAFGCNIVVSNQPRGNCLGGHLLPPDTYCVMTLLMFELSPPES